MSSKNQNFIIDALESHDIDLASSLIIQTVTFTDIEVYKIIKFGNIDIVKLLLNKSIDLNKKYEFDSPLANSVYLNYYEISKLLIENGANTNIGIQTFDIPLTIAIENQSYEIVRLLVDNGAETYQCKLNSKIFPTDIAIEICIRKEALGSNKNDKDTSLNIVKYLLENKGRSKPNTINHDKAFEIGFIELINLLRKYESINFNSRDSYGNDIFTQAALKNDLKVMKTLLSYNVDINKIDSTGQTTLMKVANLDKFEVTKFLISEGAEVDIYDNRNNCALSNALFKKNNKMFSLLLKSITGGKKLSSIVEGNLEEREKLLKSPSIRICAHQALTNNKYNIFDAIFQLGIDPYEEFNHNDEFLKLPSLIYDSCCDLRIKYFKKFFIDSEKNKKANYDIFLKACDEGSIKVVKHILFHGNEHLKLDDKMLGKGLIKISFENENDFEILKLLLSIGANCNVELDDTSFIDNLCDLDNCFEVSNMLLRYKDDIENLKGFNLSKYFEMLISNYDDDDVKVIYNLLRKNRIKQLYKYSK